MSLPQNQKALVLSSFRTPLDLALQEVPTPSPTSGSAILKVLAANIVSYGKDVYSGKRQYPMKLPLIPGSGSVCRVAAVGPDCITLVPGQLVLVEIHVRSREDPGISMLQGLIAYGPAEKLMEDEFRHGSYAEYLKAPLECIHSIDEDIVIKEMGYSIQDLCYINALMVPAGGLDDMDIKPGHSVVVAPATGTFGAAAVTVALAMGAKVVAVGRNDSLLKEMEGVLNTVYGGRLSWVKLSGNLEADAEAIKKASTGKTKVEDLRPAKSRPEIPIGPFEILMCQACENILIRMKLCSKRAVEDFERTEGFLMRISNATPRTGRSGYERSGR